MQASPTRCVSRIVQHRHTQQEIRIGKLDGNIAKITGGASGIDAAIFELFACEGANAAILDLNLAHATAHAAKIGEPGRIMAVKVVLADESMVKAAFARIREEMG